VGDAGVRQLALLVHAPHLMRDGRRRRGCIANGAELFRVRRSMAGEPWLILPTYNEAENIKPIVAAAGEVLAKAAPGGFHVLVVDDGSPDGTGELADELAAAHEWVSVLHRAEKGGI